MNQSKWSDGTVARISGREAGVMEAEHAGRLVIGSVGIPE